MFRHSMDRRTFMQGAGAAMFATVAPGSGRAQNRAKVVVIGAGPVRTAHGPDA